MGLRKNVFDRLENAEKLQHDKEYDTSMYYKDGDYRTIPQGSV